MSTCDDFQAVSSFKECIDLATSKISESGEEYCINFSLKVKFSTSLLKSCEFKDIEQLAKDFQNPKQPDTLYLNHGSFITIDGVPHVINELRNKHNGNRAIISLISQENILQKGDNPIPSFMVLQFSLEGESLYVTTYFRALEVSKFLRINFEEIRLICSQVFAELKQIKEIKLNVIAFRGYINADINPLIRPQIETLREGQILDLLQHDTNKLADLLKEKLHDTTVVETTSINHIKLNIEDPSISKSINGTLTNRNFKDLINSCLESANDLTAIRMKSSHHPDIKATSEKYLSHLKRIIDEVEKCH